MECGPDQWSALRGSCFSSGDVNQDKRGHLVLHGVSKHGDSAPPASDLWQPGLVSSGTPLCSSLQLQLSSDCLTTEGMQIYFNIQIFSLNTLAMGGLGYITKKPVHVREIPGLRTFS